MESVRILQIVILIITLLSSYEIYASNADKVPIHWNINGTPDRYATKEFASLLIPSAAIAIYVLMLLIPKIDPLAKNIKKFKKEYEKFIVILLGFLASLNVYILLWVKNIHIPINMFISVPLFVLFMYMSSLLKNAKRNWFIGIRTPWTISDEIVWRKTHLLGSKLFMVLAIISLTIILGSLFVYVFFISLIAVSILLFVYSFLEFRKMKNKK